MFCYFLYWHSLVVIALGMQCIDMTDIIIITHYWFSKSLGLYEHDGWFDVVVCETILVQVSLPSKSKSTTPECYQEASPALLER